MIKNTTPIEKTLRGFLRSVYTVTVLKERMGNSKEEIGTRIKVELVMEL